MAGTIATLVESVTGPFLSLESPLFLPYLIVTALVAAVILYRRAGSWRTAWHHLMPADIFLHSSAINDYALVGLNFVVVSLVGGAGLVSVAAVGDATLHSITSLLGPGARWNADAATVSVATLVLFVARDGGRWLQHWLQHKIPFLWELHKVHHSAEVMTPITGFRMHPISVLFRPLIVVPITGVTWGLLAYAVGLQAATYGFVGLYALLALSYTLGVANLQHSHVWVAFPRGLRSVLVSPAAHMIHHSSDPAHVDRNFGFTLAIWDWMAGTRHLPDARDRARLVLGLGQAEQSQMQTLSQLYLTPLRRIGARSFPLRT